MSELHSVRARSKRDGTRAETRFGLTAKRSSPFKSAGAEWGWCQFTRLLAVEECGSADRPWIDHVPTYSARLLATHSIRIFPHNFPSRASPCSITFRTAYTKVYSCTWCDRYKQTRQHTALRLLRSSSFIIIHSRTSLIRKLVIRIGLALPVNIFLL